VEIMKVPQWLMEPHIPSSNLNVERYESALIPIKHTHNSNILFVVISANSFYAYFKFKVIHRKIKGEFYLKGTITGFI